MRMCVCMKVYVCVHMFLFMTFHNSFIFCYISSIYKIYVYVVVNRQRHHNIQNGVVWVETGHSIGTCSATLCVWLNFEHTKKLNPSKNNFQSNEIRNRIFLLIPKTREIVRTYFRPNSNSESCETHPIRDATATAFLSSRSLLFWEWSLFFGFLFDCSSTFWCGNKHKSLLYKANFQTICAWLSKTHQKVWRLWVLVFAHDRHSHAGNCIGLPSNIGFFLSTGIKFFFLLQRH